MDIFTVSHIHGMLQYDFRDVDTRIAVYQVNQKKIPPYDFC